MVNWVFTKRGGGLYILGFESGCCKQCVYFLVSLSRVVVQGSFVFAAAQCFCGITASFLFFVLVLATVVPGV